MGDDRTLMDFDAAFEERRIEPIKFKLLGEWWEVPGSMPAALPLRISRLVTEGRGTDDLTMAETIDLAADAIPRPMLAEWLNRGIDEVRLGKVIAWLTARYMGSIGGDDPEADAPAVAAGALGSSSHDGQSSKPTSHGSTESASLVTSTG